MSELVNAETGEVIEPLTASQASNLTAEIAHDLDDMAETYERVMPKIREAMTRQAWSALGYRSGGEYVAEEFGGALQRLGVESRRAVVRELADAGMSTRAIAPIVGTSRETVRKERSAGDNSLSPEQSEPSNVVGIDGKTYPRRPNPEPRRPSPEAQQRHDEERAAQVSRETATRNVAKSVWLLATSATRVDAADHIIASWQPQVDNYPAPTTPDRIRAAARLLNDLAERWS